MPFAAGERITAARTAWDVGGVLLADSVINALGTWEDWGGETVVFDNPGGPVKIYATVTGNLFDNTSANAVEIVRVGASLDGGMTFTYGNEVPGRVGPPTHVPTAANMAVNGTPTGSVIVKAQHFSGTDTGVEVRSGGITAIMIPA